MDRATAPAAWKSTWPAAILRPNDCTSTGTARSWYRREMRKIALAVFLSLVCASAAHAEDPLQAFLKHVDAQAKADMKGFHATVAAQFGVPEVQVQAVLGKVHDPSSAFMVFQIGQMSHQPVERVMPVYESHKAKGWGAMAKELGIKPGSPEFHALKNGDLHYGDEGEHGKGHGHGHGHGNGKGKGHGDDQ